MKRDYYEILGVTRQTDEAELKKAYRKLAIQFHPDKNHGNKEAEDKFKEASEAYEVLSNPQKRSVYDQFGHSGLQGGGFGGFQGAEDIFGSVGDIFEEFFGGRRRGGKPKAQRGSDLRYELEIDLVDAFTGLEKEIEVTRPSVCEPCEGRGAKDPASVKTCPKCNGSGQLSHSQGFFTISSACGYCRGSGSTMTDPCPTCHGTGRTRLTKKLSVKIPPGVDNGVRLLLQGEGEAGERGGPAGDLYVFIHVREHESLVRDGDNLVCDVTLGLSQAVLGTTLNLPGLKGKETLEVPAGVQPGQVLVLGGKGMPNLRSKRPGDFLARVHIQIPTKLSAEQMRLMREFAKVSGEDEEKEPVVGKKKKRRFF